jgi:hypothetical protein
MEPVFYILAGPVYLHPKCEAKYNGTEEVNGKEGRQGAKQADSPEDEDGAPYAEGQAPGFEGRGTSGTPVPGVR